MVMPGAHRESGAAGRGTGGAGVGTAVPPPAAASGPAPGNLAPIAALPDWVPPAVRLYLAHTEGGRSLREIARCEGVHASTVLRQVRRFESRRDDPLVDCALGRLRRPAGPALSPSSETEDMPMTVMIRDPARAAPPPSERLLMDEARRLLPLLATPQVRLVVAADMDRAIVLREGDEGGVGDAAARAPLAVLPRAVAEAFALRDWIACRHAGRVARYALAPEGWALLRRIGVAQAAPPRAAAAAGDEAEVRTRTQPESPVAVLARRRDRGGRAFLEPRLVAAAERLREDFEIARMEPRAGADWQRLLTGPVSGTGGAGVVTGPAAARARVGAALAALGPGLGDMALRCCCWQEGLEAAERHMGWSARSGKIVLRIALEQLSRHYAAQGEAGKMIG